MTSRTNPSAKLVPIEEINEYASVKYAFFTYALQLGKISQLPNLTSEFSA